MTLRALALLREAGADIQGERVRFPKGLCRAIIRTSAPAEYIQHARNPQRNAIIGGRRTVLVPAYGSPFIRNWMKAGVMQPLRTSVISSNWLT